MTSHQTNWPIDQNKNVFTIIFIDYELKLHFFCSIPLILYHIAHFLLKFALKNNYKI
jgi:hypothetical protein